MNAQQVIEESRPMVEDLLGAIGLHTPGSPLDLQALLDPFSHWVEAQEVQPEDIAFLAGLVGAFICEFLVEHRSASRVIRDNRIFLQVPVQSGILREFEPYAVADGLARGRGSLSVFLRGLATS